MSGYPNPYKLWCPNGGVGSAARQACINNRFPGSLNGILGRGSTAPSAQAYVGPTGLGQPQMQTNLRWDERSSENAMSRRRSRVAGNNINYVMGSQGAPATDIPITGVGGHIGGQTPFRALMNAGDPNLSDQSNILGQNNMSNLFSTGVVDPIYGRVISQVSSSRRASNAGWRGLAGGVHTGGQSLWTGNQKFVYDSSDYVTFKKLQAKNRNYNDPTFGGDQHHASQVPLARVRH